MLMSYYDFKHNLILMHFACIWYTLINNKTMHFDSKVKHSAQTRVHVFGSFLTYTRDPARLLATLHHKAFSHTYIC
jgi:hypothetical protein